MDLLGRHPQQSMRPDGVNSPARPQGYNDVASRPSVDGITPAPAPATTSPSMPQQPVPQQAYQQPAQPTPQQPANGPEQPQPGQPQVLEPTHDHHRSSKPVVLAIVTLLIATGLGVAAFFAFRSETEPTPNRVNEPTKSTTTNTTPSTSSEVDSATSDINKQVEGLNDTQDFADSELSDQSLGL